MNMNSTRIIAKSLAVITGLFAFVDAYGAVDFVVDGISYTKLSGTENTVEVPETFRNVIGNGNSYAGLTLAWGDDKYLQFLNNTL